MKTLIKPLLLLTIFTAAIVTSCNTDDKETISEPARIENLATDPLFITYFNLTHSTYNYFGKDLLAADNTIATTDNLETLDANTKLELANALGFNNFSEMITYTYDIRVVRKQLEEKYKLNTHSWEILEPIFREKILALRSQKVYTKTNLFSKMRASRACELDDIDPLHESWGCAETLIIDTAYLDQEYYKWAEEDPDCQDVPYCPKTSGAYLRFRIQHAALLAGFECCLVRSCEIDPYTIDEIAEFCESGLYF